MNDRLEGYFQHVAELIGDAEEAPTTIVCIEDADCVFECGGAFGPFFRGRLRDGESIADIRWLEEPADGWPENLKG